MLSFSVTDSGLKIFMQRLFKDTTFDLFEVRNVSIMHFAKFDIDGMLNKDIVAGFAEENKRYFCTWEQLKPFVFNFIKGSVKPKSMKIVFSKDTSFQKGFHPNAAALFLNLNYEGDTISFTTATSQREFSLDKALDTLWEEYIINFFRKLEVSINMDNN